MARCWWRLFLRRHEADAIGFDHSAVVRDPGGRPSPIMNGEPLRCLFA